MYIPRVVGPIGKGISTERALKNIIEALKVYGWDGDSIRPYAVSVALDDAETLLKAVADPELL